MANHKKGDERSKLTASEAKDIILKAVQAGAKTADAVAQGERSYGWYTVQRGQDPAWARELDLARDLRKIKDPEDREALAGDFASFRRTFLLTETYPHQQMWIDLLEGQEPSWQHERFKYEPAEDASRLLINTPPEHAKSTTITMDYVTYLICKDPDVSIIIVSQTGEMAKKFLYGVKSRLTHPKYSKLQLTFGGEGGFKANANSWTQDRIYVGGETRDGEIKDPTVEAKGFGSHIYGSRANLIICDDIATLKNAHDWRNQMDIIRQELSSRLGAYGKLLVVGTRVAATDIYKELRNPDHYYGGEVPWTYLAQPAVLAYAEDVKDWETLWPVSDRPFMGSKEEPGEDGLYTRWTGPRLEKIRRSNSDSMWAMVYQQEDVSEDAIFDPVCVRGSVNGMRKRGPLVRGATGHPENPEGFYRICSMDPAMTGDMGTVAYAVDRETKKRYLMDVKATPGPTPLKLRQLIYDWTEEYRPHEWVIEQNAFQLFLTNDDEIRKYLASRGIPLKPHFTGRNKTDPDFGVASLQPLFGTKVVKGLNQGFKHNDDSLIELPDMRNNMGVQALIEQLVAWNPDVKASKRKQDTVMALWFAELRAREVLRTAEHQEQWFGNSSFTSQRDLDKRIIVGLDDWVSGNSTLTYL